MSTESIVCPFCPLCCDDVIVDTANGTAETQCQLARGQFAAAIDGPPARVGSQTIDRIDWEGISDQLALPGTPVVEFNGATLEESKQLDSLAGQGSLRIRFNDPVWSVAMDETIARDGMIAATLGDVCSRADFIWIGGDLDSFAPRLKDRLAQTNARLEHTPVFSVETLSKLNGLVENLVEGASGAEKQSRTSGDRIVEQIRRSRYTAIVLGAAPFEQGCDTVGSELLIRLIARWNEIAWRVGDGDESAAARAVMLRLGHDQSLRGVMRLRSNLLPSSGLSEPPAVTIRIGACVNQDASSVRLQIGGPDPGEQSAHAYLPASSPGVHFSGTTIRGDGSVTLPLAGWTDSQHPRRIDVLRRVLSL